MSGLRTFCQRLRVSRPALFSLAVGLALCLTLPGTLPGLKGAPAYASSKSKPVVQFPEWEAAPPSAPSDTSRKGTPRDAATGIPDAPASRIGPEAAIGPLANPQTEIPAVLNWPRFGSASPRSDSTPIHPVVMTPDPDGHFATQPTIQSPRTQPQPANPTSATESADDFATAPVITALSRHRGIEAVTTDERGRPVLLVPKNSPIPEYRVGSEVYNSLFVAEPAESDAQKLARLMQEALASYQKADWSQALVKIQQALALSKQHNKPDASRTATLHAAQAEIFVKQNRLSEALEALQKASTLTPGQYDLRIAQILVQAGRRTEALPLLERLYLTQPNDPNVAFALGTLCEDLGDTQRALTLLKQAANLHPASADIQYNLGLAFELSGNPDEAERHYQQALALNPQAEDANLALERLKNPSP